MTDDDKKGETCCYGREKTRACVCVCPPVLSIFARTLGQSLGVDEGPRKLGVCVSVCVRADLHRQVQQVFDHGDLPAGGRRVEGSVPPLVLAADLGALAHQQTRHVQMTCRGRSGNNGTPRFLFI